MSNLQCPTCGRKFRNYKDLKEHIARFHPEDELIGNRHTTKSKYSSLKAGKNHTSRKKRIFHSKSKKNKTIVVDGMNVANYGSHSKPSYKNLYIVYKKLKTLGYRTKIVVSAAMKYKIDDPIRLQKMISRGIAIEGAAGEDDDLTIIELATSYNAKVISNDRFLNHPGAKQIEKIKFTFLGDILSFNPPL